MKSRYVIALAVIALSGLSIAAQQVPRFEPSECPFEGANERDDVNCGYLVVHQNRDSAESRTLRLAVAILRSTAETPQPDPLVFLSGGPGGKSMEFVPSRLKSPFWNLVRERRDVVFFDQRGTGYSEPEFCPEMNLAFYQGRLRGLSATEVQELETNAALECREKMLADGIEFAAYNSATSAQDLDELRRTLGYDRSPLRCRERWSSSRSWPGRTVDGRSGGACITPRSPPRASDSSGSWRARA